MTIVFSGKGEELFREVIFDSGIRESFCGSKTALIAFLQSNDPGLTRSKIFFYSDKRCRTDSSRCVYVFNKIHMH